VDNNFETNVPGIFAAGNVVHVYDLVDWVTEAGFHSGKSAAQFAQKERLRERRHISILSGDNVRYVVPQELDSESLAQEEIHLQMRVKTPVETPIWVEVRSHENLVTRKSEPYARPGEILTIPLTPKEYDEVSHADQLTVAVVKK
jgi:hypothetical protein